MPPQAALTMMVKIRLALLKTKASGCCLVSFLGLEFAAFLSNNCFSTDHKIGGVWFSFGAVASLMAALATAISLKFSPKKTWIGYWLLTASVAVVFVFWSVNLSKSSSNPSMLDLSHGITNLAMMISESSNATQLKPTTTIIALPQPDFIEGTRYTQNRLNEIFPYGYVVFWYGQNHILRNQISKNGKQDWKLDVDAVSLDPDFDSGKVTWMLPSVNSTPEGFWPELTINGSTIHVTANLKEGFARQAGFLVENKPMMYVMTLSDNQRTPVFAIGFRIPRAEEFNDPKPFLIQP